MIPQAMRVGFILLGTTFEAGRANASHYFSRDGYRSSEPTQLYNNNEVSIEKHRPGTEAGTKSKRCDGILYLQEREKSWTALECEGEKEKFENLKMRWLWPNWTVK